MGGGDKLGDCVRTTSIATAAKDKPLEAIRGAAAVNVLVWHTMLGFFPENSGVFSEFPASGAAGQPWFGLIHGSFAVILFFVLSGYVLTRSYFLSRDRMIIIRSAVKRWPRLAGPVLASVLFSWVLLSLNLYRYNEAAELTGSPWLAGHLFSSPSVVSPALLDAVVQGALLTFIKEHSSYFNSSLWTMHWEFLGSFAVFGLAYLIVRFGAALRVLSFVMASTACHLWMPELMPFVAGMVLAAFIPKRRIALRGSVSLALMLLSIYLGGYTGRPTGAFSLLYPLIGSDYTTIGYARIGAACLAMIAVETSPILRWLLSGRWAAGLGRMSFPLYLVHIPVLCSVGCLTLVSLSGLVPVPMARSTAAVVTVSAALLFAVPLMHFNEWWVKSLNALFDKMALRLAGQPITPSLDLR